MRLLVRLFVGISVATLLVVGGFAYHEVREERARLQQDLKRRAVLIADAVREAVEPVILRGTRGGIERVLKRFARADRGIAIYDEFGSVIDATLDIKPHLASLSPLVSDAIRDNAPSRRVTALGGGTVWVHITPLQRDDRAIGAVAVVLDAEQLESRELSLWRQAAVRVGLLVLLLTTVAWALVRWTVTRPLARMAEWTKQLRTGRPVQPPPEADVSLFGPLAKEVTGLARTLARTRLVAEEEARLRLSGDSVWTEERLKQFVRLRFGDQAIYVVANREPLSHVYDGNEIHTQQPASGLVTALEPIMLACGGVWIAHGSGNADRVIGERVGLPVDDPAYTLRRVWLTTEEEKGYYYGFANEGLWPLCHIVHERPHFRADDWEQYRVVNEKFADALIAEMDGVEAPVVLVQDYHFALLPRMIKRHRPDARIALFWHIPWPNSEAFGICPWQEEILLGMLGADLVGFHTQYHCNNFLETVERAIEGRVEWDDFRVVRGQHTTQVQPFPISVAAEPAAAVMQDRASVRARLGFDGALVALGVERIDYTKGLPERMRAVRRFFERWPEYRRRAIFVQVASPSRTSIPRYQALQQEIRELVRTINEEVGERGWRPIVYRERHHHRAEIAALYRAADVCLVTSLHDGMNLVAKEFVAARDDEDGVLILSRFTGASRDLRDALAVNPYDVEGMADAIRAAFEMDAAERRRRMARMRGQVRERNIYRWAALLLTELAPRGVPVPAE